MSRVRPQSALLLVRSPDRGLAPAGPRSDGVVGGDEVVSVSRARNTGAPCGKHELSPVQTLGLGICTGRGALSIGPNIEHPTDMKQENSLPRPKRAKAKLSHLNEQTDVFQVRTDGLAANHVADLTDLIGRGMTLDPIRVWKNPETGRLVIADGHHRAEAYRQAMGGAIKVSVLVYECDEETAYLIPMDENGKARKPLSQDERMNRAWFLVCRTSHSKARVARNAAVSARQVGYMRKTLAELEQAERDIPETWRAAQYALKGDDPTELTEDEIAARREAKRREHDERYGSDLTWLIKNDQEVALELFQRCAGKTAFTEMMEQAGWLELPPDTDDGPSQAKKAAMAHAFSEVMLAEDVAEIAKLMDQFIPY